MRGCDGDEPSGFLSLDATGVWGHIVLYGEGLPCALQGAHRLPWPPPPRSQQHPPPSQAMQPLPNVPRDKIARGWEQLHQLTEGFRVAMHGQGESAFLQPHSFQNDRWEARYWVGPQHWEEDWEPVLWGTILPSGSGEGSPPCKACAWPRLRRGGRPQGQCRPWMSSSREPQPPCPGQGTLRQLA